MKGTSSGAYTCFSLEVSNDFPRLFGADFPYKTSLVTSDFKFDKKIMKITGP